MLIVRWLVGGALFLVLLLVALQNAEPVALRFFDVWSGEAPLVFVVLLAFAGGVASGLLAGAMKVARLKRQLARSRRDPVVRRLSPAPHGAAPGTAPASGPGFEPPAERY